MTTQIVGARSQGGFDHDFRCEDTRPARASFYLTMLNWAFAVFNSTRMLTYLPTMWAIYTSADSIQHSLVTWLAWVGANLSMAAWLYESNGRRINKAIAVNLCNAVMCVGTCLLIGWYRW